jgi:hypothetical protein
MAINKHTVAVLDGTVGSPFTDRLQIGQILGVANLIGGGAGQVVTTAVTFAEPLPPNYQVIVTASQDATAWVSGKTALGFNVNLEPRLAANTLAAGTFDLLIIAA